MTVKVSDVLKAKRWSDLGFAHDQSGLRAAQREFHPDVCHEANAAEAFIRLKTLFELPDIQTRKADGRFVGGKIAWTFDRDDIDLAQKAVRAQKAMSVESDLWVPQPELGGETLTCTYGEGWWPLRDFQLDERSVVWVAKRLMAVSTIASKLNLVHGDINPKTAMILPEQHGLRLDGWWTSVADGEVLEVLPEAPTPTKWLNGSAATPKLMVAQSAKMLLGNHDCGPLKDVLKDLWLRPTSPQTAFETIDTTAKTAFGANSWHPLSQPNVEGI